jgi:C_GCAxxG_C_C family probable redox protein
VTSNNSKTALALFKAGSNCSQSVLSTYFPILKLDGRLGHIMGTGLGAGLGRKQYVCGAVNAGAIIVSLLYGNEKSGEQDKKEETYKEVVAYINKFEAEFKSSQCREILGMEIATESGRKKATELNLFATTCVSCIRKVCEILDEKYFFRVK